MRIHAIVKNKLKLKRGRGFSRSELKDAGLSSIDALKQGIPIDPKRSTKHEENVQTLKIYVDDAKLRLARKSGKLKVVALRDVKGIGPKTAEKLMESGFNTANDLVSSTPERVAELLGISEERASNFLTEARVLVEGT